MKNLPGFPGSRKFLAGNIPCIDLTEDGRPESDDEEVEVLSVRMRSRSPSTPEYLGPYRGGRDSPFVPLSPRSPDYPPSSPGSFDYSVEYSPVSVTSPMHWPCESDGSDSDLSLSPDIDCGRFSIIGCFFGGVSVIVYCAIFCFI